MKKYVHWQEFSLQGVLCYITARGKDLLQPTQTASELMLGQERMYQIVSIQAEMCMVLLFEVQNRLAELAAPSISDFHLAETTHEQYGIAGIVCRWCYSISNLKWPF